MFLTLQKGGQGFLKALRMVAKSPAKKSERENTLSFFEFIMYPEL